MSASARMQTPAGHRHGQRVHPVVVAVAGGDEGSVLVAGDLGDGAADEMTEQVGPLHHLAVVGDEGAALTAADHLGGAQAERGDVALRAGAVSLVGGAERQRDVFHDLEVVLSGDVQDGVHLDRMAELVGHHDRLRPGGHAAADVVGVDVARVGLAVGEHRHRAQREQRRDGRQERVRRHDHLVPRLEADAEERRVQSAGAGVDRDTVPAAEEGGELVLELPQFAVAAVVGGGAAGLQVGGDHRSVLAAEGAQIIVGMVGSDLRVTAQQCEHESP